MQVYRYDLDVDLDALVRDARGAVDGWDWGRGAYGHALSLPASHQLHPCGRYRYENYPCLGVLEQHPAFNEVFEALECEKSSFRLLRRGPGSAYTWHTDSHKGQGIVRFQIPLLTDGSDFLLTTDYREVDEVQGARIVPVDDESFERFSQANAGHAIVHGYLATF